MASANRNTNRNWLSDTQITRELEIIEQLSDQLSELSDLSTESSEDENDDQSTTSSSSDSESDPDPQNSKGIQNCDSDSDSNINPFDIPNTTHLISNLHFDSNTDSDNFQNENRSLSDVFKENTINSDFNETARQAFQPTHVSSPILQNKFYRQGQSWSPASPASKRKNTKKLPIEQEKKEKNKANQLRIRSRMPTIKKHLIGQKTKETLIFTLMSLRLEQDLICTFMIA